MRQKDSECDDYEVRLAKLKPLEQCGYMRTTKETTTTGTTQVTTTTTTSLNCINFDPWIDTDSPGFFNLDDIETMEKLYSVSKSIHSEADVIECREAVSKKDISVTEKSVQFENFWIKSK